MPGIHVNFEITPEKFLADLTEAAYHVALKHGLKAPFIQVELDLQHALREVIRRDMKASWACGSKEGCCEEVRFEPWTKSADGLFEAE